MNSYLLFNSNTVNFLLKTDGGGEVCMRVGVQKALLCYFCFFGCFNCWWMRCGVVGKKVLFLGQAEIACFCLFRDVSVSSRYPCLTSGVERFSLALPSC